MHPYPTRRRVRRYGCTARASGTWEPPPGSPSGRGRSKEGLTAGSGAGGMVQAAKARGNARDTPTWTTLVGLKGSKSECRRHEPGGNVRVCMEGVALAHAGTRRLQAPKAHLHSRQAWRPEDGPPA